MRPAIRTGLLLIAAGGIACTDGRRPDGGAGDGRMLSLVETLGGIDTAGYARADAPRTFAFPRDHGPHPDFRTEWWYVTGNLTSTGGREFGFQFTIFRNALSPVAPGGPSAWSTNQAFMGHFALTDIERRGFHAFERFARGAGGLAGAEGDPLRVWIEDWRLSATAAPPDARSTSASQRAPAFDVATVDPSSAVAAASVFPLELSADGDSSGIGLELLLDAGKPFVLQGVDGLSQKGSEAGNASYYYAHTRMPARGRVMIEGDTLDVSGLAWLDREWSTSALSPGQVGWDWFALQLDDGWEMMVYQLRNADGTADALSDGVLVDPRGRRVPLEWGREVTVEPTGSWVSPIDGARYPSGWRIRVPGRGWDLRVDPAVLDQELRVAFRYWEGSVRVSGTGEGGADASGRGYVELTGYAGVIGG